jgi:hypothetical protein
MVGLPSSPRRRRRLAWLAALAVLAAGIAALAIRYPNTGEPEPPFSTRPASVYVQPATVPFTGARREAARQVARAFLLDAVLRKDPAAAWGFAAPSLRQGMTRAEWRTGNIPVVPFSADALLEARWRLSYSYLSEVGFEVGLFPKPGAAERGTTFTLELKAFGRGSHRHWLVSSWVPAPSLNPPPPAVERPTSGLAAAPQVRVHSTSAYWLVVPLGLLGLALVVPVALGLREWLRGARAEHRYRSGSGRPTSGS